MINTKGQKMPKTIEQKRNEAKERQEKYNNLSIKERIAKLDKKFGKGIGAKKERTKLRKRKE